MRTVGTRVARSEGLGEGITDGEKVVWLDGARVGVRVGTRVGTSVGARVGEYERKVGIDVGHVLHRMATP
jgi:hypothetical protein